MKTFTLCLKIFTFLLLIWIFPFFYKYDSSKSLINKVTLETKIGVKHERTLAEVEISEKKSSYIKKRVKHHPSDEKEIRREYLVYLMDIYITYYSANIITNIVEVLLKEENEMIYKYRDKILNAYRNNISTEMQIPHLSLTH
ncbi:fam-g protein [Plasmodium gallinaceum]|uniref:Fam-g protein n=1 Tax=Plasmodium gallinaceum TaxID=5849 RepID=A0A1J1GQB6_PLAGA|nr:fam-g protein [Plasmodium gallinaceum]CRG94495.1 fam-g protein [Plasmodium gallinaceum]